MSIQFPTPASQGDTFTASNGVIYTYDNGGWTANSVSGLDNSYVNISGDTMTGDLTVPSLNGGPLAGFRNHIINGDFRIWQRGINVDPISLGDYGADRWLTTSTTTANSRMQKSGNATTNSNGVSGMLDANELGNVMQAIELSRPGFNSEFPIGSQWTLSFYTDQDLAGRTASNIRFRRLTSDPGYSTDWVAAADVSGTTWQSGAFPDKGTLKHYWFTFTITGDASTIASGTAESLAISFPSDSSGLTKMTYCQLEPGPVATPFEQRPIGTELALCQRYYEKSNDDIFGVQVLESGNTSKYATYFFKATKRVAPVVTVSGSGSANPYTATRYDVGYLTVQTVTSGNNTIRFRGYTADAEL